MKKVLVICGATATGKTKIAVDCALKLNTEIISADSQLVYKNLNVGTAKPSMAEMRGVKHHMIDVIEPDCNYSVTDYRQEALPILERLLSEDKVPVICGGTGFYINSLLFDLSYGKTAADVKIREKYANLLRSCGKEYVYNLLKEVDAEAAEKLHINDTKRVVRALEIFEAGGKKKSEINDTFIPKYEYCAVAIDYPREELYSRINARVDKMFDCGLVDEVVSLLKSGLSGTSQSMQAIGYKEIIIGLKNGDKESTMRDVIKQNTRHYAKRQITFFKKLRGLVWLKAAEATAEKISELLNE